MQPIPKGHRAIFETTVTREMTVDFEGLGKVHPVYATYWLAKHMELTARKIILPFLDEDEDGIGAEIAVSHLAPTLPGTRIRVVGEHIRTKGNRVRARLRAYDESGELIGEGESTQVIVPRRKLEEMFAKVRRRQAA